MRKDASALAVGHWEFFEGRPCLVYDYVDRLMVGEGIYKNEPELRLEHIVTWLEDMNILLPCFKGVTDQHGGTMLVQLLRAYDIESMELIHLNPQINSKMYHTFKGLIDQGSARFPDVPKFTSEVKLLEAELMDKYRLRVQAPKEEGSHDDMADAAALVALIAVEWATGEGSREMTDMINSPSVYLQSQRILQGGQINLDLQYASLQDLRMLERQGQVHKIQVQLANGVGRMASKYEQVRRGRGRRG
jgi:hypothetical protein